MRSFTKALAAAVVAAGSVVLAPATAVPPVHVLVGLDAAVHVLGPRIGRRTRRALAVAVGAASGGIGTAVATSVLVALEGSSSVAWDGALAVHAVARLRRHASFPGMVGSLVAAVLVRNVAWTTTLTMAHRRRRFRGGHRTCPYRIPLVGCRAHDVVVPLDVAWTILARVVSRSLWWVGYGTVVLVLVPLLVQRATPVVDVNDTVAQWHRDGIRLRGYRTYRPVRTAWTWAARWGALVYVTTTVVAGSVGTWMVLVDVFRRWRRAQNDV